MNIVDPEVRSNLLDRLRVIATLQQWLWQEATVIADEILDCELDAVLRRIPDLAVASSGERGTSECFCAAPARFTVRAGVRSQADCTGMRIGRLTIRRAWHKRMFL